MELTNSEEVIVKEIAKGFSEALVRAYGDKEAVRLFLVEKGYPNFNDTQMEDDIYEGVTVLDKVQNNPETLEHLPSVLLYGVLQILDGLVPEGAEDFEEYQPHFSVMEKGILLLQLKNQAKQN